MEAVEDGGYEAKLCAVEEEEDEEEIAENVEKKAAKVGSLWGFTLFGAL